MAGIVDAEEYAVSTVVDEVVLCVMRAIPGCVGSGGDFG